LQLLRIARSYLRQAEARLEDARDALSEGNYPYAVRLSQECVELSLKAALKAVGIDYPKVHDVSDVLEVVSERFPEWFSFNQGCKFILVFYQEVHLDREFSHNYPFYCKHSIWFNKSS